MWVGIDIEHTRDLAEKTKSLRIKTQDELYNHFNGALTSIKTIQLLKFSYFFYNGTSIITSEFGFCEYCTSYIGVSAVNRRFKNVSVLNSYCKELVQCVRPKQRCKHWEPNSFYEQILSKRIIENTPEVNITYEEEY